MTPEAERIMGDLTVRGAAQIVSYGGGTNSAAMLVGLHQRGERPDAIVFADTGGEKPHTYGHLWTMQEWCDRVGFPAIQIVRGEQPQQRKDGSLENECLRLGLLPSKAYGFASCSDKWKIDPQERWARRWLANRGEAYMKLIGFHAGEDFRVAKTPPHLAKFRRYPLIEWGWDYEDCQREIEREGLPLPGKSACFFCPSTKKTEILQLRQRYPELLARALEIERKARAGEGPAGATQCGLGRRLVWVDFLRAHDSQGQLFADGIAECEGEACFT